MTVHKSQSLSSGTGPHVQGQILRHDILSAGGNVLIVPFRAGVQAAASEDLDRISLIVMRGMMDELNACGGRFQILHHAQDRQPDMMITGNIVRFEIQGGWKRYFGGNRTRVIEFQGKVVGYDEELVAVFSYTARTPYQEIPEVDFLLKAGKDVGLFLSQNSAR